MTYVLFIMFGEKMNSKQKKQLKIIKQRYDARHLDYGVKGMKWGHHKAKEIENELNSRISKERAEETKNRVYDKPQPPSKKVKSYRALRDSLADMLKDKDDGTYDPETGESVTFKDGYQVAFQTSVSEEEGHNLYLSDEEYDEIARQLEKETGSRAYVGKFDVPEISFYCKTYKQAMDIAKKYNQMSICNWKMLNKYADDWSDEACAKKFPSNPFYNPNENHVKGE